MAPFIASGYEPLKTAFTSYSLWEALNFAAISLTRSPSVACIACHHWISVLASAGVGAVRTAADRARAQMIDHRRVVVRDMAVLLVGGRFMGMAAPVMLPAARVDRIAKSRSLRIVALTAG